MSKKKIPTGKNVVHVDVETNGISRKDSSLLSVCVVKGDEVYERFYFPEEEYNEHAIKVNGLNEDTVEELRRDETYPAFYKDDQDDLVEFLDGVDTFIAFNVGFDFKWMPEKFRETNPELYCTMKESKSDVHALNKKGTLKNPNLKETVEYYGIMLDSNLKKTASEDEAVENFHDAQYDVMLSKAIFEVHCES